MLAQRPQLVKSKPDIDPPHFQLSICRVPPVFHNDELLLNSAEPTLILAIAGLELLQTCAAPQTAQRPVKVQTRKVQSASRT